MPAFAIVVAADRSGGIGKSGGLPWRLKGDMAYFKRLTQEAPMPDTRNAVIMGRITWESIPDRFRPLPGRVNVVVSGNRDLVLPADAVRADHLRDALDRLDLMAGIGRVFVIGGGQIYRQALEHPGLDTIYLTRVQAQLDCDTHFPEIPASFTLVSTSGPLADGPLTYGFLVYERTPERSA